MYYSSGAVNAILEKNLKKIRGRKNHSVEGKKMALRGEKGASEGKNCGFSDGLLGPEILRGLLAGGLGFVFF